MRARKLLTAALLAVPAAIGLAACAGSTPHPVPVRHHMAMPSSQQVTRKACLYLERWENGNAYPGQKSTIQDDVAAQEAISSGAAGTKFGLDFDKWVALAEDPGTSYADQTAAADQVEIDCRNAGVPYVLNGGKQ